jgi:microcystin-dependent protein
MFRRADRIQEVCSLTGLTVVLGGAKIGARAFSSQFAEGDTCYACISTDNASEWEVSLCSYATGNLTRGAVISSSNNDAQVAFAAGGNHTVTLVAPASKDIALDPAGNVPNIPGNVSIGGVLTVPTIAGVALTGAPTAPTPPTADNDTSIATTEFVKAQGYATIAQLGNFLPLTGGAVSGLVTVQDGTNTPIALGRDADNASANVLTLNGNRSEAGAVGFFGGITGDATMYLNVPAGGAYRWRVGGSQKVYLDQSSILPLADNTMTLGDATHRWSDFRSVLGEFSGVVKGPTAAPGTNTTQLASTAFVHQEMAGAMGGYAPLDSPVFTGDPKAPTVAATDNDTSIATTAFVQAVVAAAISATPMIPAGIVWDFAGPDTAIPAGWYLCDGSLKNRTGDARLFAAIGTTYNTGGEAADQFRLPDFRGRVRAMVDKGSGRLTGYNLGTAGGAETHTLTAAQMPTHTHADSGHNHGYSDPGHNHGLNQSSHQHALYPVQTQACANYGCGCTGGGNTMQDYGSYWISQTDWRQSGDYNSGAGIGITIATNYANLANTGGGTAHPNVQPTIAVNAIIKA